MFRLKLWAPPPYLKVWIRHCRKPSYKHCLQVAFTTTLEGGSWGYPYIKISAYRQATQPMKGWPHHRGDRGLRLLLFSNSGVSSFPSHKNRSVKVLWDGPYGFLSSSEKTRECLTICRSQIITEAAFSSQLFKDPEFWSDRGLNPEPQLIRLALCHLN